MYLALVLNNSQTQSHLSLYLAVTCLIRLNQNVIVTSVMLELLFLHFED